MNQFFSFGRFRSLVLMHWAQNRKRYGLSVLAYVGLLGAFLLFSMMTFDPNDSIESKQQFSYFFSLFTVGTFYASQYFRDLGSRSKAINFLLVPASTFEKILCGLLYTVVLFPLVFTAAFYLVDLAILLLFNKNSATNEPAGMDGVANVLDVGFFLLREDLQVNGMLFFLAIQSVFLLGSVYFKKYSFMKTILACFVAYLIVFCAFFLSYKPIFPGDGTEVAVPRWIEQAFGIIVMFCLSPVFWIWTYHRLKQKQV